MITGTHNFFGFSIPVGNSTIIEGLYELCHPISSMPHPSLVVRHISRVRRMRLAYFIYNKE